MKDMNKALNELVELMKADYVDWMKRCDLARGNEELSSVSLDMISDFDVEINEGRSYYKIVKKDRSQRMCAGFVCKVANKKNGFEVGDLLKAASYNAPATNFARGSIFDLETAYGRTNVRWTGIQ